MEAELLSARTRSTETTKSSGGMSFFLVQLKEIEALKMPGIMQRILTKVCSTVWKRFSSGENEDFFPTDSTTVFTKTVDITLSQQYYDESKAWDFIHAKFA
jgi:hypothetical protein